MDNLDNQPPPSNDGSSLEGESKPHASKGIVVQVTFFADGLLAFAAAYAVNAGYVNLADNSLVAMVLMLAGYGVFAVWGLLACAWPMPTVAHTAMALVAVFLTAVSKPWVGSTAPAALGIDEDTVSLLCNAVTLEMVLLPMGRALWNRRRSSMS
jgi:hypothetical protein